jgi:hypothetical protein
MGSLLAYFHKQFRVDETKMKARRHMSHTIKSFQQAIKPKEMDKCDKCEEFFEKGTLLQDDLSTLRFCNKCMDAIKILRDAR